MTPYRESAERESEVLEVAPDPFPTIACADCRKPTTKVSNERRCARCDLRWLLEGGLWVEWLPGLYRGPRG